MYMKRVIVILCAGWLLYGIVAVVHGQLLVEEFDYPAGSPLTQNGWSAHSAAGSNPILVVAPGLEFRGYRSSAMGNAAQVDGGGEDVNRLFAEQFTGTLFVSLLVNVLSVPPLDNRYFFHLGESVLDSHFGRIFAKDDTSGHIEFGVSKLGTGSVITQKDYSLNTTYLLVMKYEIIAGPENDRVSLFVFDAAPAIREPAQPNITAASEGSDPVGLARVALRQNPSTPNVTVKIDGIRIDTTWNITVPIAPAQPGSWYASTDSAGGGQLLAIDPGSGAASLIGATGIPALPGLAINSSGNLYAIQKGARSCLYRIDAENGGAFRVDSLGLPVSLECLAFADDGRLYAGASNGNLYRIDTLSAVPALIANTGLSGLSGLSFDPLEGTLYASAGNMLYTVNPLNGAASAVGNSGLAGVITDIQFDEVGNLYGVLQGEQMFSDLIAINKHTAAATVIGSTGFAGVSGLAFFPPPCTPGLLGDVNDDHVVNSTDALLILSYDAALPLPQPFQQRITLGFGEVTEDGQTNSTDGLAVLSFDAVLPPPFPVGQLRCLPLSGQ